MLFILLCLLYNARENDIRFLTHDHGYLSFVRLLYEEAENMQAIKCELCGSSDLVKTNGIYLCQHCGTKYTAEEAKKLFVTVKLDKTDVRENSRTLARRAIQTRDIFEARRYYDALLAEEPNNWEAYFFSALCKMMLNTDLENEVDNIYMLNRTVLSTIHLIVVTDRSLQENALTVILENLNTFLYDRTKYIQNYYYTNRNAERLSAAWIESRTSAYGSIYESYQNAVEWNFKNVSVFISQADKYYYDYVMYFREIINWRLRREIKKRFKQNDGL